MDSKQNDKNLESNSVNINMYMPNTYMNKKIHKQKYYNMRRFYDKQTIYFYKHWNVKERIVQNSYIARVTNIIS